MGFHRYATPVYAGGLRVTDDYINNAGAGTPSPADAALGAGPNVGSYFYGTGEGFTTASVNRGMKALAQNCDFLDDAVVALDLTLTTELFNVDARLDIVEADIVAIEADIVAINATIAGLPLATVHDAIRTLTTTATLNNPTRDCTVILEPVAVTPFTITLPAAATCPGQKVFFFASALVDPTTAVTLAPDGAETINGLASPYVLDIPEGGWLLVSDSAKWHIRYMSP